MGKTLYLDCYAGISGDMMAGCLLDLGADREKLMQVLDSLQLEGYEIEVSRVKKSGIDMCDFAVLLDEAHENHDHDMEYLHGEHHGHTHHHDEEHHHHEHDHDGEHHHDHTHKYGQNAEHAHAHRGLSEIREIIGRAGASQRAKETALHIFDIIGDAEAKAHGLPKEEVHFHEVGAVDSIVDIMTVAVCLDDLDITEVIVPSLCEGRGMVRCQHGQMPVPVPAVVNIVSSHGLTLQQTEVEGELITPTGAAIVAAIRTGDKPPAHYRILSVGMGAGKRSYSRPSILRGMLIEAIDDASVKGSSEDVQIWKLESNIDDTTGEGMGYVMEQLLACGARDVHYIPVYMKKNRPSYLLNVICEEAQIASMEKLIFENTTTIGIRKYPVSRSVLSRRQYTEETEYGTVEVKECILPDGTVRRYPEYESIKKICKEKDLPYQEAYQKLMSKLT